MGLFDWDPPRPLVSAWTAVRASGGRNPVPKKHKPPRVPKAPKVKQEKKKLSAQEIAERFQEKVRRDELANRSPYPRD